MERMVLNRNGVVSLGFSSFPKLFIGTLFLLLISFSSGIIVAQENEALIQEEQEDYFKKWVDEDVIYIISDEERKVFEELTTPEEKENFIEQFWFRRDPDPKTAANEFKTEHYRRLAYVNEKFSVGMPGWMSDRGRIYIIHGPPVQIEAHPTGGQYQRPLREGGGWTQAYPWERWRYHFIEGIGQDIELEFVDRSMTGQYKLALNPEQKDALLQSGKGGPTIFEIWKLESKGDRPYLDPRKRDAWAHLQRQRDMPFERYLTYARVQGAKPVKYKDLQELVKINVTYEKIPFTVRIDYFQLNEAQVLVPVTMELEEKHLSFSRRDDIFMAEVAVYGLVTSLSNQIVEEFEDELATGHRAKDGNAAASGRAVYQKMLVLENTSRYKLDLVVKDLHSGRVGIVRKAIVPPKFGSGELTLSKPILSNQIFLLEDVPDENPMFVLGDVKIRPSLDNVFRSDQPLGLYFQAYNSALDQSSLTPSLSVSFRITHEGDTVLELLDESEQSVQFFSSRRMVFIQELPVMGLRAGRYNLEVRLDDHVGNQSASAELEFEMVDPVGSSGGG
jgi:GWxTD domain-containing protein